ncbi:MAG: ABC transporter ATP-binding protein [Deltaproteobacteria bacterium]|nr:ABC transporter ATP-binding protein [Deltaproteobacteria bacterium]
MNEPLLVAQGLKKTFASPTREVEVLKGVDLTVRPGESICILGVSGTGKSTLLHILGTLDVPTDGTVQFEGKDVFGLSPVDLAEFRNRRIGFVFQFHYLLPEFTALENVMMPALIARTPAAKAKKRAEALLERVGVAHRLTHKPGELSGGEQQRVAIARALMMSPALLLADEPTGNLDPETARTVHELILSLNEKENLTLIVVSHNPELANFMDSAYRLSSGVLVPEKQLQP